jgi:hypothetical protein
MTLDQLKTLMDSGEFHHATYRHDFARGLHIYAVAKPGNKLGFRGFEYVGYFSEYDKELCDKAYEMTRKTGVSLGSYGQG